MVLQNLSWQQFAVFVLVAAAVWYLVIYLLYFRRGPKSGSGDVGALNWKDGSDRDAELDDGGHPNLSGEYVGPEEASLMGASREDEGVGNLGMHELEFSGPDVDPEPGSLERLTGQLKDSVARFSEAGESSKPALVLTLAGILREHPELLESDLSESVLLLLCDYAQEAELPYSISVEELRAALEV